MPINKKTTNVYNFQIYFVCSSHFYQMVFLLFLDFNYYKFICYSLDYLFKNKFDIINSSSVIYKERSKYNEKNIIYWPSVNYYASNIYWLWKQRGKS